MISPKAATDQVGSSRFDTNPAVWFYPVVFSVNLADWRSSYPLNVVDKLGSWEESLYCQIAPRHGHYSSQYAVEADLLRPTSVDRRETTSCVASMRNVVPRISEVSDRHEATQRSASVCPAGGSWSGRKSSSPPSVIRIIMSGSLFLQQMLEAISIRITAWGSTTVGRRLKLCCRHPAISAASRVRIRRSRKPGKVFREHCERGHLTHPGMLNGRNVLSGPWRRESDL